MSEQSGYDVLKAMLVDKDIEIARLRSVISTEVEALSKVQSWMDHDRIIDIVSAAEFKLRAALERLTRDAR